MPAEERGRSSARQPVLKQIVHLYPEFGRRQPQHLINMSSDPDLSLATTVQSKPFEYNWNGENTSGAEPKCVSGIFVEHISTTNCNGIRLTIRE